MSVPSWTPSHSPTNEDSCAKATSLLGFSATCAVPEHSNIIVMTHITANRYFFCIISPLCVALPAKYRRAALTYAWKFLLDWQSSDARGIAREEGPIPAGRR